ncbi:hypothetical protein [Paractinoplanes brasiliensis]|uniref:Uncharacterized protein n=1 Tax=Paractinoplanes brasiliensis TaxID=52695 RepID=A0A4R6JVQ2_9ACTN|nr:hypothetical protein [Actinoplanes brasiliensis]TDO39651.1 hypothetical protein C8E87_3346 [Actinoplanes brasiliensis]GID29009.1 hypothetical protein Abr02nite_39920 [Actinoplanes brasiliensis]
MSFDWSGEKSLRINVVSWPISEKSDGFKELAQWKLKTLDILSVDEIRTRLAELSSLPSASSMDVRVEVVSADELLMTCEYDSSIPEPMRLGAASVTWRFLDEELARLWMIGDSPRSHFPEFMRQRRAQLDAISSMQRLYLMFASIIRVEPLIAAAAGAVLGSSRLLAGRLAEADGREALLGRFTDLASRLAVSLEGRGVRRNSGHLEKADLGSLMLGLGDHLKRAISTRESSDIAQCIEMVFDSFYLFDEHYSVAPLSLARSEDRDYRDDLDLLLTGNSNAFEVMLERSLISADSIRKVIVGADVRRQLLNAII